MTRDFRAFIRRRARGRCEYCHLPEAALPLVPFHIDHIIALQHAGSTDPENLALACDRCNAYKGPNLTAIDPHSGSTVSLYHPRRQHWATHFRLSAGHVLGLTPTGRATVHLLRMNAEARIQLRLESSHPPPA